MSMEPGELPPVGPIWSALRMLMQAFIRSRPRKEGERFLKALGEIIADEDMVFPLHPIRPKHERVDVLRGQRQASNWLRASMPLFIASLRQRDE